MIKEGKSLITDVDQQLAELQRWRQERERDKKKEDERQKLIEAQQKKELEEMKAKELKLFEEDEEKAEQMHMEMMRRNHIDIGTIEHIKIKKENNARDILNQQLHSSITSKLQSKEQKLSQLKQNVTTTQFAPDSEYSY